MDGKVVSGLALYHSRHKAIAACSTRMDSSKGTPRYHFLSDADRLGSGFFSRHCRILTGGLRIACIDIVEKSCGFLDVVAEKLVGGCKKTVGETVKLKAVTGESLGIEERTREGEWGKSSILRSGGWRGR